MDVAISLMTCFLKFVHNNNNNNNDNNNDNKRNNNNNNKYIYIYSSSPSAVSNSLPFLCVLQPLRWHTIMV